MALNGPKVAARWVDERRRTWWPLLKWWHFTTHPCAHTRGHTHLQYLSHPVRCTALRWRERTQPEQEVIKGAAGKCGRGREQTRRVNLDRQWFWADEQGWESEEVVSVGFCVWAVHSHLIKRLLNCAAAGQVFCACLCVKRYMERWWKVTRRRDDSES